MCIRDRYTLLNIDRGVPEVWGSTYDVRDLLNATVQLRDGKKLTDLDLGFKERIALMVVLNTRVGPDRAKLLKQYTVILMGGPAAAGACGGRSAPEKRRNLRIRLDHTAGIR